MTKQREWTTSMKSYLTCVKEDLAEAQDKLSYLTDLLAKPPGGKDVEQLQTLLVKTNKAVRQALTHVKDMAGKL